MRFRINTGAIKFRDFSLVSSTCPIASSASNLYIMRYPFLINNTVMNLHFSHSVFSLTSFGRVTHSSIVNYYS